MKLQSLNMSSEILIEQKDQYGIEGGYNLKLNLDRNCNIELNAYEFIFYELLNGISLPTNDRFNTGFIVYVYDEKDKILIKSNIAKLKRVECERGLELIANMKAEIPKATNKIKYITRVEIAYISSKNDMPCTYQILNSNLPQNCQFSEDTDSDISKGIAIDSNYTNTIIATKFKISFY